jgi:HD-like signal output (HDOD) protein
LDENTAFTAALLHDVGKIVLNRHLVPLARQLEEAVQRDSVTLLEAEKKLLRVQHAEVGGRLLERWSFPEAIVSAVWFHHQPRAARPHDRLAACVYLGNCMALRLGEGFGRHPFAVEWRQESLEILRITEADWEQVLIQMVDNLDLVEALSAVPAPK